MSDTQKVKSKFTRFLDDNQAAISFVGMAAMIFALLQIAYFYFLIHTDAFAAYLRFCADLSGGLLNLVGEEVSVSGRTLTSVEKVQVTVVQGCDALRIYSVLVAAILAYDAAWVKKLTGIIVGVGLMFLFNVVRISALLWVDIHFSDMFDTFHHTLLPMGLWLIAMGYFYYWGVSLEVKPAAA